jgi:hypothetical protein
VTAEALEHLRALERVPAVEPKRRPALAFGGQQAGQPRRAANLRQRKSFAKAELGFEIRDAGAKGPDSRVEIGGVEQR